MVVAAVAFGAGFVRLALGLGAGVLFTPILALAMEPARAVVTMTPLVWVTYVHGTVRRFGHRDMSTLAPLLGPAFLGLAVGAPLLASAPPDLLRRLIGAAALVAGLLQLWRGRAERPARPLARAVSAGAGFVVGLVGAHGVPLGLYLARASATKEAFIANVSIGLLVIDTARLGLYWAVGVADARSLLAPFVWAPLVVLGGVAGAALHDRLSHAAFFRALSVVICAIGMVLLFR